MGFEKAVNEIASLLTQGGTPSNHAGDIASRLIYSLEDYYNFRQSQGNAQSITGDSANSRAFKNAFRAPEEYPGGRTGDDGTDGRYAWAVGKDGQDGEEGSAGQDGSGQNGTNGTNGTSGGGYVDLSRVSCKALKKKLADCGIKTGGGCEGCDKCNPKCCPGYGGTGMLNGQSLCAVVDAQARMLKEIRGRLDDLEKKMEAVEKTLADTVDCPP